MMDYLIAPDGGQVAAYLLNCETGPCSWLSQDGWTEDGEPFIAECLAPVFFTADGYECLAGHDFVTPEARREQGWDYAADEGEAALLAKYGVEPRHMSGHVWVEPLPVV